MKKNIPYIALLLAVVVFLIGCTARQPVPLPLPEDIAPEYEAEETIPEYAAHIKGVERFLDPVDYADPNNWLCLPESPEKSVDAIFLYPTVYGTMTEAADDLAYIDDMTMRLGAALSAATQASVFEESCNLYIPYYRQFTVAALLDMNEKNPEALSYCVSQDIYRMLDYYFENRNEGRPFILAGHSQGSMWLTLVLEDYMARHPEYLENMVAAYVIGYSVTEEYLARNPHLKFAKGADDTGVIVSYNTEGPGNRDQYNCVVLEGAVAINPINWVRDDTYASAEENAGSLNADGEIGPGIADARIDLKRGVVICESVQSAPELQAAMAAFFGSESYHLQDYSLYYANLKQNVADRIAAFERG